MNTLAIDTSNQILGVAVLKDQEILGEYMTNLAKGHSERLMPAMTQLMKEVSITPEQLDQIVVAKGPGSYTGVRIGLTTAKTMAWALKIPIIGISSIKGLSYQGRLFPYDVCPFFDARRKMIYTALYQWQRDTLVVKNKEINIAMEDWLKYLAKREKPVLFLSPHISQYEEIIQAYLKDLAIIPESPYHIPRPSHLVLASINEKADHPHTLVPNYLRLAEAEANWLKKHKGRTNDEG